MSEDQIQHLLERLLQELRPHIRLLGWILGGVVSVLTAVITGTVAVVMFVAEVRSGVQDCRVVNESQQKGIGELDREQRALSQVVYRHVGGHQ
jgi:hypothetical protein